MRREKTKQMRKKMTMFHRVLAMFLVVALVLSNLSITPMEASANETETYDTWALAAAAAGEGTDYEWTTEYTALTIKTEEGLAWFANSVNTGTTYSDVTVTLERDLDLTTVGVVGYGGTGNTADETVGETNSWTAIGTSSKQFLGTFNGAGYTVSGVYIKIGAVEQGLFSYVGSGGTVKNVGVIDSNVISEQGYVGGVVGYNAGIVDNCYNSGVVQSSTGAGNSVGGVVGNNRGTVKNCYNLGSINDSKGVNIGGIVGHNTGTVENCYNLGEVKNSYGDYIGGIVGYNDKTVENCYNTGNVSGGGYVGGVVGYNNQTVENCYNTGDVTGSSDVGGVVGNNSGGTVTNCYYNSDTYSGTDNGYGTAKTIAEMTASGFANTLDDAYEDKSGGYYPYLTDFGSDSAAFCDTAIVTTETELTTALANSEYTTIKFGADITIAVPTSSKNRLTIERSVDIDFNGYNLTTKAGMYSNIYVADYIDVNLYNSNTEKDTIITGLGGFIQTGTNADSITIGNDQGKIIIDGTDQTQTAGMLYFYSGDIVIGKNVSFTNITDSHYQLIYVSAGSGCNVKFYGSIDNYTNTNDDGYIIYICGGDATFEMMDGSSITNSSVSGKAGAIRCQGGNLIINDGVTISATDKNTNTYAIYCDINGSDNYFNLSGNTTINGNIYLYNSSDTTVPVNITSALTSKLNFYCYGKANGIVLFKGTDTYTLTDSDLANIGILNTGWTTNLDTENNRISLTNKLTCTITLGDNVTLAEGSGAVSQTVTSGTAITDIVINADSGYGFTNENINSLETINGITATRDGSNQTIIISGTPTADTEITMIDATAQVNAATPVFDADLVAATYEYGETVTALDGTATVTDGGTVTYQWCDDNGSIYNATGATYTPSSGNVVYDGTYYVIAKNTITNNGDGGTKTVTIESNRVTVEIVPTTPIFNTDLDEAAVTYYYSETPSDLTVKASASLGSLTYQWYKQGADDSEFVAIEGETSASYTPSTTLVGTTQYKCVAIHTHNGEISTADSKVATITVAAQVNVVEPTITTALADASYIYGETATALNAISTVTDSGTLTYKWYSLSDNSVWTEISNAASATYTPSNTAVGTTYYKVEVTNTITDNNDGGTKTTTISDTAAITVAYGTVTSGMVSIPSTNNGWYTSDIVITATDDYTISTSATGTFGNIITISTEGTSVTQTYYIKGSDGKVYEGTFTYSLDKEAPTATISIEKNEVKTVINTLTFGLFFKKNVAIVIEGEDILSDVDTIEYQMVSSDETYSATDEWTTYESISVEDNAEFEIYAKVTDKAGNYVIVNTENIVVYTDIATTSVEFDFIRTSTEDASFSVKTNGNTVKSILNNERTVSTSNYTVSSEVDGVTTITFTNAYLQALADGVNELTIKYNPYGVEYVAGDVNDEPAATTVEITVYKVGTDSTVATQTTTYNVTAQSPTVAAGEYFTVKYYNSETEEYDLTEVSYTDAGIYTVKYELTAVNYQTITGTITYKIAKADPSYTTPTGLTATYGDTLAGVTLPEDDNGTFSFADTSTSVGSAGTNDFEVTYTPDDTANYNVITDIEVEIVVAAKSLENDKTVSITYDSDSCIFTNAAITPIPTVMYGTTVLVKDTDYTVSYSNNTDISKDTATITISFKGNYSGTATTTFDIVYGTVDNMVSIPSTSNGWYNADFAITANSGYTISTSPTSGFASSIITTSGETDNGSITYYVKDTDSKIYEGTYIYKIDETDPTATVTVDTSMWDEFLETVTFGIYKASDVTVKVTSADELSGVYATEYYVSNTVLTFEEVEDVTSWTKYEEFTIPAEDAKTIVVYVKVTDNAGNVTYISSDGTLFDTTAPVVTGVKNLSFYKTDLSITVTDANLDTVTLNGETVQSAFEIKVNTAESYTIIATDLAGNSTVVKFTTYVESVPPVDDVIESVPDFEDETVTEEEKDEIKETVNNLTNEFITNTDSETAKDDAEIVETLNKLDEAFVTVNGNITVVETTTVVDESIDEDKQAVVTEVVPQGLAIAVYGSNDVITDSNIELSLSVKQIASDSDSLVFNVKPMVSVDGGDATVIPNEDIKSPVTFRLYLNDSFKGTILNLEHIKEDGTSDVYENVPIQSDDIGKYVEITVSEFSNFVVTEYTYEVSVDGEITEYKATETVTLTVPEKDGYEFIGFESNDVEIINNSFEMPENDVTITTTWEEILTEEDTDVPDTGDHSSTQTLIVLMFVSMLGIFVVGKKRLVK